jgi:nitroreductase
MTQQDDHAQAVLAAITSRRSVRAYRETPVPRPMIETILQAAARAPSGTNMQPWQVRVLTGATKDRLTAAILQERATGAPEPRGEYPYYPEHWIEPYLKRRRTVGWALYGLLGIGKGDAAAARAWHDQNFRFFGAPVGLVFTMDRSLESGSFLDSGMFIQNVMTAARGLGLDTCPQAAFVRYHATIRRELALPDEQLVLCGMALGWADPDAIPNKLHTDREPLESYVTFMD